MMSSRASIDGHMSLTGSSSVVDGDQLTASISVHSLQSEVLTLKQKLESKSVQMAELANRHKQVLSDREHMESELVAMKEKVKESDNQLSAVRAESEAAIRQIDSDQHELAMIRRRSLVGGGNPIILQMYETILTKFDKLNTSHRVLQEKYEEESDKRVKLQKEIDHANAQESGSEKQTMIQMQAMNERLQADLQRVREERTLFKREYSLVMSERDAMHKEMDKLQDDLAKLTQQLKASDQDKHQLLLENDKLTNQMASLQQQSVASADMVHLREELFCAQRERKQALQEKEQQVRDAYAARKAHDIAIETVERVSRERDQLATRSRALEQEKKDALVEAKDQTRWRELAFSERDKLSRELEESRRMCDVMTEEREKLVKQLEEAVKAHDATREVKNALQAELSRVRNGQESKNTHSHDSAIDTHCEDDIDSSPPLQVVVASFVKVLPRQHEPVTIEQALLVTECSGEGDIRPGDRLVAINNRACDDMSTHDVRDALSPEKSCLLRLTRPNVTAAFPPDQPNTSEEALLDCGTSSSDRHHLRTTNSGVRLRHDLNHSTAGAKILQELHRDGAHHPQQRSDDIAESSAVKKRKPKLSSSRLVNWSRKKKSKSVIGSPEADESTHGTWPRLDSPSLTNLIGGGGRLSVFSSSSKKRTRPLISPNTFVLPADGKNQNQLITRVTSPPTPITITTTGTVVSDCATDESQAMARSGNVLRRERHQSTPGHSNKKKRPDSAPITPSGLSAWAQSIDIGSGGDLPRLAQKKNAKSVPSGGKADVDLLLKSPSKFTSPASSDTPHPPLDVAIDIPRCASPAFSTRSRKRVPYERQKSVPERRLITGRGLSGTSVTSQLRVSSNASVNTARSATSLPRPSSARPSLSVVRSSTTSTTTHIATPNDMRRARTLDYCQRIRIPSEASVGVRLPDSERGSLTVSSDRSLSFTAPTQFPDSTMVVVSGPASSRTDTSVSSLSVTSSNLSSRSRPTMLSNDPRYVKMVKGGEPIGISIVSGGESGGIFVSHLTENSLAAKAGLEYGDQLLEYNGINLRNAKEEQARVIMSQTQLGDTITFLAQYNFQKYKVSIESNLSDTLRITQPKPLHVTPPPAQEDGGERTITPDITPRASPHVEDTLRAQTLSEARFVFMDGAAATHIKLVGGNSLGIFVADNQPGDATLTQRAGTSGLRIGDRILEFNSVRFDNITLEGASVLLSQSTSCSFYVKYDPNKYKQIYGLQGDHFYVRALFDHMSEREGALCFTRNSILLVENTFPDYTAGGQWVAWLVDEQGERSARGRIPSKLSAEKDVSLQLSPDDNTSFSGSNSGKRLSGSGRRSFFKRRKPHRTSSRSSGDVRLQQKSLSETSLESTTVEAEAASTPSNVVSYQVVEKHSSSLRRPVVVFGPHSQLVVERMARDHHQQFVRCAIETMRTTDHGCEIIESYTHASETLVLTVDLLQRTMTHNVDRHALLEISPDAIDRLHALQVYPIIVFIKYPTVKKIKESQDRIPGRDKITTKQCKEIMDKANQTEKKLLFKYHGTVTIAGGASSIVASKLTKVVSHEHAKVLWLPAVSNLLKYSTSTIL